tara:strand:- start:671 stop:886 length:216 start_codon:yes stop_codon:yes gene_type:complete
MGFLPISHSALFGELLSNTADERGADVSFSSTDTRGGGQETGIYDFVQSNILGGSSGDDSSDSMNDVLENN